MAKEATAAAEDPDKELREALEQEEGADAKAEKRGRGRGRGRGRRRGQGRKKKEKEVDPKPKEDPKEEQKKRKSEEEPKPADRPSDVPEKPEENVPVPEGAKESGQGAGESPTKKKLRRTTTKSKFGQLRSPASSKRRKVVKETDDPGAAEVSKDGDDQDRKDGEESGKKNDPSGDAGTASKPVVDAETKEAQKKAQKQAIKEFSCSRVPTVKCAYTLLDLVHACLKKHMESQYFISCFTKPWPQEEKLKGLKAIAEDDELMVIPEHVNDAMHRPHLCCCQLLESLVSSCLFR